MQPELALKYWEAGNAIVAFSVLQMLAFLYALAKQDFREQIAKAFWPVVAAIVVSAILYAMGVEACYRAEMALRSGTVATDPIYIVLRDTRNVRVGIIGFYSLCGTVLLLICKWFDWGHKKPR